LAFEAKVSLPDEALKYKMKNRLKYLLFYFFFFFFFLLGRNKFLRKWKKERVNQKNFFSSGACTIKLFTAVIVAIS
jgi:hypothetical protein